MNIKRMYPRELRDDETGGRCQFVFSPCLLYNIASYYTSYHYHRHTATAAHTYAKTDKKKSSPGWMRGVHTASPWVGKIFFENVSNRGARTMTRGKVV